MNLKFDNINGGLTINNAQANWVSAGFDRRGKGLMTLQIEIKTENVNYLVSLSKVGQTTTRTDEAIDYLMNELLQPYIQD